MAADMTVYVTIKLSTPHAPTQSLWLPVRAATLRNHVGRKGPHERLDDLSLGHGDGPCVARDANMGQQSAGGNSSCCPKTGVSDHAPLPAASPTMVSKRHSIQQADEALFGWAQRCQQPGLWARTPCTTLLLTQLELTTREVLTSRHQQLKGTRSEVITAI